METYCEDDPVAIQDNAVIYNKLIAIEPVWSQLWVLVALAIRPTIDYHLYQVLYFAVIPSFLT